MSCDRNGGKVSTTAAAKVGIGSLASKAGNVVGATSGALTKLIDLYDQNVISFAAPVSNAVLATVDRPSVAAAKALPFIAAATARLRFGVGGSIVLQASNLPDQVRGTKLVPPTSGSDKGATRVEAMPVGFVGAMWRTGAETKRNVKDIGTVANVLSAVDFARGALMDINLAGQTTNTRTLTLEQGGTPVAHVGFSKAPKLTAFLNKTDLIGSHRQGKDVVSSQGDAISHKGRNWHRGTMVIKTPGGERTLTHLQSISAPSHHFYFDRAISDQETAEIVTASGRSSLFSELTSKQMIKGKSVPVGILSRAYTTVRNKVKGIKTPSRHTYGRMRKPHQIEGYVGEVHTIENLMPIWGSLKKAMITTRLYHPPQEAQWTTSKND